MKKLLILSFIFICNYCFAQRVIINNEQQKYKNNPSLIKLVLMAQTDDLLDLTHPPINVVTYIGDDKFIVPGLNWYDKLPSPHNNQIYSGVYVKINNEKKIFSSIMQINDTVKVALIKREKGIIQEIANFQSHIKDLQVVTPPGSNISQEVISSADKKYSIVIEGTNSIVALSIENKTYFFFNKPILLY